jgi:hypothetical protein
VGIQQGSGETDRLRIAINQWTQELREWPMLEWPPDPVRPVSPTRGTVLSVRFLILLGVVAPKQARTAAKKLSVTKAKPTHVTNSKPGTERANQIGSSRS